MQPKRTPSADEIAEMAERGENITQYFHKGKMMPPIQPEGENIQRVNVDFTYEMLADLDSEAKRVNVSRQAIIKTMLSDALDRRMRLRAKSRKKAS